MATIHVKFLSAAAFAVALSGCATGSGHHVENATGQPIPHHALAADEVYLDGTGPSARRLAATPHTSAERLYAEPVPAGAPTRAIVRSRPTALERTDNASSTTGTRNSARSAADKPFSDQWWENERREDARIKSKMDICRGC